VTSARVPGDGTVSPTSERRVRRLLRWYPPSWRQRYGDEFAELLLAEMAERPASPRRAVNVMCNGLLARLTRAGLTSHELPQAEQVRAGLATIGCALAAFGALAVAMLAQLATGWQWASPQSAAAAAGTVVLTVAVACLALIGAAAVVPVAWLTARAMGRRKGRLGRPGALAGLSATVLIAGTRHFENGWPGTGGTGAHHGLVPGGLAAFGWASTLSVSSYWAHPGLLLRFPLPEVGWMLLSPLAFGGLMTGLVLIVRRLELPRPLQRYLAALATAAVPAAVAVLAGAASWVLDHGPGQTGLFQPGLVDGTGLAIMSGAVVVALRAVPATLRASRARE
jgi:hypothetical protein